jgi:hypothetical protein
VKRIYRGGHSGRLSTDTAMSRDLVGVSCLPSRKAVLLVLFFK